MLICNKNASFRCNKLTAFTAGAVQVMHFAVLDSVSPEAIKNIFADANFYFYDDLLNGRLPDTHDTKLVGLRIDYNADSTCTISIKITKGDVDDES